MEKILEDIIMRKSNDENSASKENELSVTGQKELLNKIGFRSHTS